MAPKVFLRIVPNFFFSAVAPDSDPYIRAGDSAWFTHLDLDLNMSPSTFSIFAIAAVVSTAIYSFFTGESKDDDEEQQSAPQQPSPSRGQSTFASSDHRHNRDSYYYSYSSLAATTHSTPSASTRPQPSYQQPRVEPSAAQATANTKKSPEPSPHVHRHGLASSTRSVPTSAAQAQIPHQTKSTASRVHQTTSTTSDHLDPVHRTNLTSTNAWDSPLTPSTPASTHTSYTAKQISALASQTTARTPTRTDYDNSTHRSDVASSSSIWESYQTTPTRTHASYLAQQTSARVSQTTSRTPARTDYDSSLHRSDFASPSVSGSRQTPSTHALYLTQQSSTGVVGTTVRTVTMADYDDYDDDMGPSPYSYLRTPSPDASRTHVSPKKHSRTQSSSSDSDYLGPSSRTRAVPRSGSHEVHDAIADAQDRKKAMELREHAKRSARDMREARDRANIAHRKGDDEAENEYRQEARAHESAKKNSDKRAAKIFFRVNNKAHEEGTVDLHDLYVAEAVEYAKEELQSAIYRDDNTVTFIVGQGRHSEDGVPKLRPALEELFNERRHRCSLDPGNAGKLIVYLD